MKTYTVNMTRDELTRHNRNVIRRAKLIRLAQDTCVALIACAAMVGMCYLAAIMDYLTK